MKTTKEQTIFIRPSAKFYGKFEVVTPKEVIPCHNFATARTIARSRSKDKK